MRKNPKPLVFVLTLMLLFTFPITVFADTADEGSIGGGSTVENVVLNVMLPTSLNFALDPLSLTESNNQIKPADYFFVNMTLAPVKVQLNITATTSGDAILVEDPDSLSPDDPSVEDKELYFAALAATGVSGDAINVTDSAITSSAILTSSSGIYSYTSPGAALIDFTPNTDGSTGAAVVAFALNKATEGTTTGAVDLAASDKGVAVFQFYGVLNTYADWQDGDLSVTGSYTLTPLRTSTYDDVDWAEDGLNLVVTAPPAPPAPSTYSITVANDGHGTASADLSTATPGAVVTLTATPDSGYQFDSWASTPSGLSITTNTFTMPSENVTVKANFTAIPTPVGFTGGGSTTTKAITVGTITSGAALDIPFNFGGKTLTSITTGTGNTLAVDQYIVGTDKITFIASRATTLKNITASTFYTIHLSDSSTYVINWNK